MTTCKKTEAEPFDPSNPSELAPGEFVLHIHTDTFPFAFGSAHNDHHNPLIMPDGISVARVALHRVELKEWERHIRKGAALRVFLNKARPTSPFDYSVFRVNCWVASDQPVELDEAA